MYILLERDRHLNSSCPILVRLSRILYPFRDTEAYPGQDDMTSQKTKEEHYKEAAMCINASDNALRQSEGDGGVLFLLARGILAFILLSTWLLNYVGIHQLATRSMDDALRCFDAVLSTHPTNVIALLGKVCTIRSSGMANFVIYIYLDRHASCMLADNTHKLSNFSKMSYAITQHVSQTPELGLACAFGL